MTTAWNRRNKEKYNAYIRRWKKTHPQKINEYARKVRNRVKTELFNLLGNKCNRCGFSDKRILEIDHVNGGGSKEIKAIKTHSGSYNYYLFVLRKVKAGSKEYQLLCPNCNRLKYIEMKEKCL